MNPKLQEPTLNRDGLIAYDKIIVCFSGGKDCLAALLYLLELDVPREKIELAHHLVDGEGANVFDWPVTENYVRALASSFQIPLFMSWRVGGFTGELWKTDAPTAEVTFETTGGERITVGGGGKPNTRRRFPQQAANLRVRWCSSVLKIDVMDTVLRNDPRLQGKRILVIDGCRAEESPARAKYKAFEIHRADARRSGRRHVDAYRPVLKWSEAAVWDIIRRYGVVPHPAYQLSWSRVSCRSCIFLDKSSLATLRDLYPEAFAQLAQDEANTGYTIAREGDVTRRAAAASPFARATDNPVMAAIANGDAPLGAVRISPADWRLPLGAFKGHGGGPT